MLSWFARYFITSVGVFLVLFCTIYDWYIYSILFVLICMIPQHKSLPVSPVASFLSLLIFPSLPPISLSHCLLFPPLLSLFLLSLCLSISISLTISYSLLCSLFSPSLCLSHPLAVPVLTSFPLSLPPYFFRFPPPAC